MCIPLSLLCVPCRETHQDWETNGEQVLQHILALCPSCASQSAVFCGLLLKHLSSLANIYQHSMLHGGVALSKTFCNVPSSNLNFFGEGPLHDHATTFVLFCSFVMHGLQKQYWHSSCEVSGGITNSGLSSSSVSFATLSLFACIL